MVFMQVRDNLGKKLLCLAESKELEKKITGSRVDRSKEMTEQAGVVDYCQRQVKRLGI